jgi:hypothetical protein
MDTAKYLILYACNLVTLTVLYSYFNTIVFTLKYEYHVVDGAVYCSKMETPVFAEDFP